jgi:hypothetical protein
MSLTKGNEHFLPKYAAIDVLPVPGSPYNKTELSCVDSPFLVIYIESYKVLIIFWNLFP